MTTKLTICNKYFTISVETMVLKRCKMDSCFAPPL